MPFLKPVCEAEERAALLWIAWCEHQAVLPYLQIIVRLAQAAELILTIVRPCASRQCSMRIRGDCHGAARAQPGPRTGGHGRVLAVPRRANKECLMADTPVPYGPHPVPLETAVVSCWRFGGPSRRHVLRFDPCETCTAMLAEVQARHQGGA